MLPSGKKTREKRGKKGGKKRKEKYF